MEFTHVVAHVPGSDVDPMVELLRSSDLTEDDVRGMFAGTGVSFGFNPGVSMTVMVSCLPLFTYWTRKPNE